MKYFIGNPDFSDLPNVGYATPKQTHEVSSKGALEMYRIYAEHNGYDGEELEKVGEQYARGIHKLGKLVTMRHYDLWGEDISNEEMFKLRLSGKLAKAVIL